MMFQKTLLSIVLSLFSCSMVYASYGDCGLGTQITSGNKTIVSQTFAYTTNGTSHITSVVTQTSGCDYSGIVQKEQLQEFYVMQTYVNIEEDAAKGEGPYLIGLAELMDCAPEAHQAFALLLQSNFDQLFEGSIQENEKGKVLLQRIKHNIRVKPQLAAKCKVS
ncbi:MAG: DUF3015 family protein [SAR324 cluster bacterium]|nr:DUF3015 family protein [SAR324 cluster bacterium]